MIPQLLESVGEAPGDSAAERLDIGVYPDDPQATEEFRRLTSSEMAEGRSADRSAFVEVLDAAVTGSAVLSPEQAESWLLVLGEARLTLAARLGIETEGWGEEDSPEPAMALLHYLSWLQGALTEALLEGL